MSMNDHRITPILLAAAHFDVVAVRQLLQLEFPPYLCSTVPFSVSEVIVDEVNASLA